MSDRFGNTRATGPRSDLVGGPPTLDSALQAMASLSAAFRDDIAANRRARDDELEAPTRLAFDAEQAAVQRFSPANDGEALWTKLRNVSGFQGPLPNSISKPPSTLEEAADQYPAVFSRARASLAEFVRAWNEWERRFFSRARDRPSPTTQMLSDIAWLRDVYTRYSSLKQGYADELALSAMARLRDQNIASREARRRQLDELTDKATSIAENLIASSGHAGASWTDAIWTSPSAADWVAQQIRVGEVETTSPAGKIAAPVLLPFPFHKPLLIQSQATSRRSAIEVMRSIILRTFIAVPPGKVRLVAIDPVGLGQSVAEFRHLASPGQDLVEAKTWTTEQEISQRLTLLTEHLERVISTYLRGQYQSLDDYNVDAGELAQPYILVSIFDYPEAFSQESARKLLSLMENGSRCGIFLLVNHDSNRPDLPTAPSDRLELSADTITFSANGARLKNSMPAVGSGFQFHPDACPPISFDTAGKGLTPWASAINLIVDRAQESSEVNVTLPRLNAILNRWAANGLRPVRETQEGTATRLADPHDVTTWWRRSSADSARALIGQTGAQNVAAIKLSSTTIAGGAIIVGIPRSGKSTSLHAIIMTLALNYSPSELELFLVDSKHGVEFKTYEQLPHARMISIRSEREFAVAILERLCLEIAERARKMKNVAMNVSNISEYRTTTGEVMSRIVLVMDEFHELFEDDDDLGRRASRALENLIRQGPFAGVHVIVASQTLASTPALDKNVLRLLPIRVAFACTDFDGDLIMGDDNIAVRNLSGQGVGILNAHRGQSEHNELFRGVFVPPHLRADLVKTMNEEARSRGLASTTRVFDGDSPAQRDVSSRSATGQKVSIIFGEPFDLSDHASLQLHRRRGGNIVLVGSLEDAGDQSFLGAVQSTCVAVVQAGGHLDVVDFVGPANVDPALRSLRSLCEGIGAAWWRNRDAASVVSRAYNEMVKRREAGDYEQGTRALVLHGVQRALDLNPVSPYDIPEDVTQSISMMVHELLRDGPDFGLHIAASVSDLRQFDRRIGRDSLQEFDLRLTDSNVSENDLQVVYESKPPVALRPNQLLAYEVVSGRFAHARAYPPFAASDDLKEFQ